MVRSFDTPAVRRTTQANIFGEIFKSGTTSRIEIARELHLNKATVSAAVDDLIQQNLVREMGYGESQGGRKPILLAVNSDAAYTISIDVQITHVTTGVLTLTGDTVWVTEHPLYRVDISLTKEQVVNDLIREIHQAMEHVPPSSHGLLGVGIALPGMVDANTGHVYYLPNLELSDWELGSTLAARIPVPVYIDNDANCGALAEHIRTRKDNMVFINAGIGIGAGIVARGLLYRGEHGIAGEYGHMTISAMGLRCSCGSYGCWEEYASERALLRMLQERGELPDQQIPHSEFMSLCVARAQSGQHHYLDALTELGRFIGIGIANICNTLDPSCIFVGGSMADAFPFIAEPMRQVLRHRAMPVNHEIEVIPAERGSVIRGASRLVLYEVLLNQGSDGSSLFGGD